MRPPHNLIERWVPMISGFTQDVDRANGFDKLWLQTRRLASETTSITMPMPWNSKWTSIANYIHRNSVDLPTVEVIAYSWGCGHGFVTLAKRLRERGIVIQRAVLCDPVYHSWLRPWRAMAFSPHITIPGNVLEVHWLRQTMTRPMGTDLQAESSATTIHEPVIVQASHTYMDDAPEFHALCAKVLT